MLPVKFVPIVQKKVKFVPLQETLELSHKDTVIDSQLTQKGKQDWPGLLTEV